MYLEEEEEEERIEEMCILDNYNIEEEEERDG